MTGSLSPITECVPEIVATATLVIDISGSTFAEITREVLQFVTESRAKDGALVLLARHTSASLSSKCRSRRAQRSCECARAPCTRGCRLDSRYGRARRHAGALKTMLTGVSLHVPVIGGLSRSVRGKASIW